MTPQLTVNLLRVLFLRVAAGYSHGDVGTTPTSNAVYLGVQMQR